MVESLDIVSELFTVYKEQMFIEPVPVCLRRALQDFPACRIRRFDDVTDWSEKASQRGIRRFHKSARSTSVFLQGSRSLIRAARFFSICNNYTKWSQNIPNVLKSTNGYKIYIAMPSKDTQILIFMEYKYTIWQFCQSFIVLIDKCEVSS
jgi:hypothetical protein